METTVTSHQKNIGTFIHLSTFAKWFFPFGNFIAPLIIWSTQRKQSHFTDANGRNAINFQLSMLLYLIGLTIITIPFIVYFAFQLGSENDFLYYNSNVHSLEDLTNLSTLLIVFLIAGTLALGLFILEIVTVIAAAIKASQGGIYKYPLTISFISEQTTFKATSATDRPIANKEDASLTDED